MDIIENFAVELLYLAAAAIYTLTLLAQNMDQNLRNGDDIYNPSL